MGLPLYIKVLICISFLPTFWLVFYYDDRGYKKKARQCEIYSGFGAIFWIIFGIVLWVLHKYA